MDAKKQRFSLGLKMNLFVILTVFVAALGVALLSFAVNVGQIDRYFKRLSYNSAQNFSAFVDPEFLEALGNMAESEEYQTVRDQAEADDDEELVAEYLRKEGLYDQYMETRHTMQTYLSTMEDIKYLYIVKWGGINADVDMYIMDDEDNPIYQTGYYEEREEELRSIDPTKDIEPTISHGDWGWLCSAYAPVYNADGKLVCHIGCDVGMEDIMHERYTNLTYILLSALGLTIVILLFAMLFANRVVVRPLNRLTLEMQKFKPAKDAGYAEAGVMELPIKSHDEIQDIYQGIRSMQIRIIDYLNDLSNMQRDKERAESEVRDKEKVIGEISREAYKDALTCVGNKAAYARKVEEIKAEIENGKTDFAIVMVDINNLKYINDTFGHNCGDTYIKGCCHLICETFKHSPVFRIGGDEFVVLLQGEDYQNRMEFFKKLKNAYVFAFHNESTDPWLRYSAAMGMAEYAFDDNTVELVFKRADKAMYMDKQAFKQKYGSYR